ncbi:MerR family DNA-binding transcriptional regulator [Pseudonocardia phyllosphaerae]|uniref:MerR family DNA-binding transcriptional regulator n=1 Tax=Pseudonocardia phyllosphaerae TaxID=3390502 RepID=UPI0039784823
MLGIGEFAGLTGLGVKALRHYDEKGILVPAEVDARSGYRRYGEGQVRAGVTVRALRDAGVPLPQVSDAVAGGDAAAALAAHRRSVLAEREAEDQAFATAGEVLRALAAPVAVAEREMPAQPFVGHVIRGRPEELDELSDDVANAAFGALYTRLRTDGLGPSGPAWSSLRSGEQDTVDLVCCWPTTSAVDDGWCGPEEVAGILPARTELVVTWSPADAENLPEGPLHPAAVGLYDAVAERRIDLGRSEVRQGTVVQDDGGYVVELVVSTAT